MNACELVCVPPSIVGDVWPHAKAMIQSAIVKTKLSRFADVERAILSGRQLLWLAWNGKNIEAAASTEIDDGVCVIVACGGERRSNWLGLLKQIELYARDAGCRAMRIFGRRGWERALSGYRARHVILEKAI